MPYYGYGTDANSVTKDLLGAPPDILSLSAYGDYNIKDIPVVLTDLSIEWPNDVDYITTENGEPFPVIMHIGSLSLKEARSAREYSGFDIVAYRGGDMVNAYNPVQISADQAGSRTSAQEVDNGDAKVETNEIESRKMLLKKSEPEIKKPDIEKEKTLYEQFTIIPGKTTKYTDEATSFLSNANSEITQSVSSSLPFKTTFKGF